MKYKVVFMDGEEKVFEAGQVYRNEEQVPYKFGDTAVNLDNVKYVEKIG